jgi:hypothetical protein
MDRIRVAVVNASSLDAKDVAEGVAALQQQVSQDFAPVWNVDAELSIIQLGDHPPGAWGLVLLDDRPYAEITSAGLPLAQVRVNSVPHGQDWTHTASRELLEMLANPWIAGIVAHLTEGTTELYAREVCDPCSAYANRYLRGPEGRQRPVSDFVFPGWFGACDERSARLDERSLVRAPFEVLPGGYAWVFDPRRHTLTALGHDGTPVTPQPAQDSRMRELAGALDRLPKPPPLHADDSIWSP